MRKKLAAVFAVLVCTASGCYFFPAEEELLEPPVIAPDEVAYSTYTAKIRDIQSITSVTGYLRSHTEQECYFTDYTGKIKNICVGAGDIVEEGDLIAQMNTGALDYELEIQRLKVQAAQLRYNSTGSQADKLQLDIEQSTLEMYQAEYDGARVYAPMSGQVYYVSDINPGAEIDPFKVLARIADPNDLFVSASYSEAGFSVGDKVTVDIQGETYAGTVSYTRKEAQYDRADDLNALYVEFDGEVPAFAYMGELADIKKLNAEAKDTVVIPKNLVKTNGDRKYVLLFEDGERREVDVEVGITNATEAQILSGVKAGDKVIVK